MNAEEEFKIMSRRNGTRIVKATRFPLKARDQGLTRKPLTLEWLERYGSSSSHVN